MKQESTLRQLWAPVAASAALVLGGLTAAGGYLESLRVKPAPRPQPLSVSSENETWERIHLPLPQLRHQPDNGSVRQAKTIELMVPATPEEIGQSTLQAHQIEQRLSKRDIQTVDTDGLAASVRETTKYLQQRGARCATIISTYTPDAGNAAQGSYVGLRLQFDKSTGQIYTSNLRPVFSDHEVMMNLSNASRPVIAARTELMTGNKNYTVRFQASTDPAICQTDFGMPNLVTS